MQRPTCSSQFKLRNFGFYTSESENDLFYRTEWNPSRRIFLVYRVVTWAYQLGWWMAYHIYFGIYEPTTLTTTYLFLTTWAFTFSTIYFTLALALAMVGVIDQKDGTTIKKQSTKALRDSMWVFHSVMQTFNVIVTVLYWAAFRSNPPIAFSYHTHGINVVLSVIDVFVVAFPMRLFHVVYPFTFSVAYFTATLIFHFAGVTSAVYALIDWANHPGLAAGIGVAGCTLGCIIGHSFFFGLYSLRLILSRKSSSVVRPSPVE
ncbi:protein rolling stone-like [Styela clava]